jgi:hypothetical protein
VEALVLRAALDSEAALAEAICGAVDKARPKPAGTGGEDASAPKMHLERIQVSSSHSQFRLFLSDTELEALLDSPMPMPHGRRDRG